VAIKKNVISVINQTMFDFCYQINYIINDYG